jgi:2-keto-4-pentenoate hydratase/2-oxohepta-3-ene-1,7-dioic acid hydratase in catechol pathway
MKFVSFRAGGAARYGIVEGNGVIDLSSRLKHPDLKSVIVAGALEQAAREARGAKPDYTLDQIQFAPVIANPSKLICIGVNYESHREEIGMAKLPYPTVFIRWPDAQVGHQETMVKPKDSDHFDYEGELALVLSKGGRYINEEDAASYIAGYACYNDGSIRDFQKHSTQFTAGKNFPATAAFGPYLVTPDEVGELANLKIQTRLNGQTVQSTVLGDMTFPPLNLISYVSGFTELSAGDVIITGTPGGVGWVRKPNLWMKAGDVVEVEIDRVGLLRNTIASEA